MLLLKLHALTLSFYDWVYIQIKYIRISGIYGYVYATIAQG